MKAPGRVMLLVTSILFIVFGAILAIVSLLGVLGSIMLASMAESAAAAAGGLLLIGTIVLLIASVLELVIGIIGVGASKKPEKAMFFIVTGIILCVLQLVGMIMNFSVWSLIGFVLPILFIVGGFMNKNAAAAPAEPAA